MEYVHVWKLIKKFLSRKKDITHSQWHKYQSIFTIFSDQSNVLWHLTCLQEEQEVI